MKDASKHAIHILEILKERGYRITKARTEVVKVLSSQHEPQTIQQLTQKIKSDEVSVYRTIATLREEGLIEEISTQGSTVRYALSHGHHHHVVCTKCETIAHVPCGDEPKTPTAIPGFAQVTSHELTFYGLCKKCA